MRGIVVIILAIIANLVLATALMRGSWSPILVLAIVLAAFAIIAVGVVYHREVIAGAGRVWTWIGANTGTIAKSILVIALIASALFVLWLLAVKAVTAGPTVAVPLMPTTAATPVAPTHHTAKPEVRTMTVHADRPARVEIPQYHKLVLIDAPGEGWVAGKGYREGSTRIQFFNAAPPVREISLRYIVRPCSSEQDCAW